MYRREKIEKTEKINKKNKMARIYSIIIIVIVCLVMVGMTMLFNDTPTFQTDLFNDTTIFQSANSSYFKVSAMRIVITVVLAMVIAAYIVKKMIDKEKITPVEDAIDYEASSIIITEREDKYIKTERMHGR